MKNETTESRIVIYDGVCNFCNRSVNFIIQRDKAAKFSFTPMQSEIAQQLIAAYQINNVGMDTFLLVKDGRCYTSTDAALEIASELDGLWYLCRIFKLVPRLIRDYLYRVLARNRYKLFGRAEHCIVPSKEIMSRFIGF